MANPALESILDRSSAPLDRARRDIYAVSLRAAPLRWVLTDRARRIAVFATLHAVIALVLAVTVPALLLVLGPVLLGVPHVAADVRYLVVRRQVPQSWKNTVWIGCAALLMLRVAELVFGGSLAGLELVLATLWVVASACFSRASWRRRSLVGALALALGVAAILAPRTSRLVLAHGHNLVAIVLWVLVFRGQLRALLLPVLAIGGAAALLVSGTFTGFTMQYGAFDLFGLDMQFVADWLAPGLPLAWAVGIACSYAFLQSVHYAIWLGWIPQEDVKAAGPPTVRMSARSLLADFGAPVLVTIAVLAILVPAIGAIWPLATSAVYLTVSGFHVYLELALLALFLARGVPAPNPSGGSSPEPLHPPTLPGVVGSGTTPPPPNPSGGS